MKHGGITKINKNQNPRWPPATVLDFGLEAVTFDRVELDTSKLAQGWRFTNKTWRNYQNLQRSQFKMAACRHHGFRFWGHNFSTAWTRHFKFAQGWRFTNKTWRIYQKSQKSQLKMAAFRHFGFRFRGHIFWTSWSRHLKFGTGLKILGKNMAKSSNLTKTKIQDGSRMPSWISV